MVISGPTGCGKTTLVQNLLNSRSQVIYPPPNITSYFFGEHQRSFLSMKDVRFYEGLDDLNSIKFGEPHLIIIDDLMSEASKSEQISNLFTKGSHHRNVSVILLIQNFFSRGEQLRNITLNAHYVVLFKNPRDKTIARSIACQMYPTKVQGFQRAYELATENPFSYFFIDLKPKTPESLRLLSNVLGEERFISVYKI